MRKPISWKETISGPIWNLLLILYFTVTSNGVTGNSTTSPPPVDNALNVAAIAIAPNAFRRPLPTPRSGNPADSIFFPAITDIEFNSNERITLFTTLTQRFGVSKQLAISILQPGRFSICTRTDLIGSLDCNVGSYKYRSVTGIGNNVKHPTWGSPFTALNRLLPPLYTDGFNEMAYGFWSPWGSGGIPNARFISALYSFASRNDPGLDQINYEVTNMVPQFGQFLDHDLTNTPKNDQFCCRGGAYCANPHIQIPDNDYFYNSTLISPRQRCIDFTRSTPFCFPTDSGVREQFNSITAYLDASMVYGSTSERSRQLRLLQQGKLRVNKDNAGYLPTVAEVQAALGANIPFQTYGGQETINAPGKYLAGDDRVNQNPGLTALHILFMREHNRLCDEIIKVNPRLSDEDIYQTARRILIAEWQNVVYSHYLPTILGGTNMKNFNLELGPTYTNYNAYTDASIVNSFATAAYRFGHSMLNGLVELVQGIQVVNSYWLRDNFFDPTQIDDVNGFINLLGGLMTQNARAVDPYAVEDVTNLLFKPKTSNFGSDLIARNIQRGRDHGLPSYNEYRQLCGLDPLCADWKKPCG